MANNSAGMLLQKFINVITGDWDNGEQVLQEAGASVGERHPYATHVTRVLNGKLKNLPEEIAGRRKGVFLLEESVYEQLNVDDGAEAETVLKPLLLYIEVVLGDKEDDGPRLMLHSYRWPADMYAQPEDIWPAREFSEKILRNANASLCIDYNDLEESKTFAPALYTYDADHESFHLKATTVNAKKGISFTLEETLSAHSLIVMESLTTVAGVKIAPKYATPLVYRRCRSRTTQQLDEDTSIRHVAIVTGGASGIGAGVSDALAREGFDLVLGYMSNSRRCKVWAQVLARRHGAHAVSVGGDCSNSETFDQIFSAADALISEEHGKKLHVAVHCAGQYVGITSENSRGLGASKAPLAFGTGTLMKDIPASQAEPASTGPCRVNFRHFDFYMDLYAKGFCNLAERCCERMVDGGAIVGISAPGCSTATTPRAGTYDMPMGGKAVMEQMSRYYARTLAPRRIRVNCVSPGITQTPAWARFAEQVLKREKGAENFVAGMASTRCPMKVPIQPADVGDAVAFLCSSRGKFVTGVTLPVDGGLHLTS
eukprot:g752.t1